MTTDITAVEADGQFYVNVSLDGHDKQYGPYSTADEAEIMAARMGAICRGVCRFAENILSEAALRKKYRLAESAWEALGSNDALVEKIENENLRRIRDGSSKREKAQLLIVKAPDVVAKIMLDDNANARHRIDASKTLNDFAANGPGPGAPAADRFVITINLGSDTLKFDKSIAIDPNDVDPNDTGTAPQGLLPIIAAKKKDDDQW